MTPPTLYAFLQTPPAGAVAAPASTAPGGPGAAAGNPVDPYWNIFMMFGIPLLAAYFILIRPAQRQEKQRKALLGGLKKNDEVVCAGGIVGKVAEIKEKPGGVAGEEDTVVVRIDDKNRLTVLRSAIVRVNPAGGDDKKDSEAK